MKKLDKYLIEEVELRPERVKEMSNHEKLDAWLKYNGIIGYTYDIEEIVEELTGKRL